MERTASTPDECSGQRPSQSRCPGAPGAGRQGRKGRRLSFPDTDVQPPFGTPAVWSRPCVCHTETEVAPAAGGPQVHRRRQALGPRPRRLQSRFLERPSFTRTQTPPQTAVSRGLPCAGCAVGLRLGGDAPSAVRTRRPRGEPRGVQPETRRFVCCFSVQSRWLVPGGERNVVQRPTPPARP